MERPIPVAARMRGLGLVEIRIAMTLGLILLAGLYQIFLSNKITYNTQQALSRLQENARYVMYTLSHDLWMAGYAGCRPAKDMQINVIAQDLPAAGFTSLSFVAISGENDSNDKDTVTIRGASGADARVSNDMKGPQDRIMILSNPDHIGADDLAYISDCSSGDIFRVAEIDNKGGHVGLQFQNKHNKSLDLSKRYGAQARVSRFRTTRYYVADADATVFPDGRRVPALWRSIDDHPTELVQGVEDMQIQYGVDTNADSLHSADVYKTADEVTHWDNVVSVRIALLMQSLTLAADTPDTTSQYTLLDKTVGPFDDRYGFSPVNADTSKKAHQGPQKGVLCHARSTAPSSRPKPSNSCDHHRAVRARSLAISGSAPHCSTAGAARLSARRRPRSKAPGRRVPKSWPASSASWRR